MSDDFHIPALNPGGSRAQTMSSHLPGGYHARRGGRGGDGRLLKWAAAGLCGLLLLGGVGWAVVGRRPATVPVIEADSRPLRVKPDNPGGMQIAGADELGQGDTPGRDRMAPSAETPAPQALRAQMQQAAPEVPVPAPSTAAPPPGAPAPAATAVAPPVVPPVAAGPAPVAAATPAPLAPTPLPDTPARPAAKAAPARPQPAGGTVVQLGALASETAAQTEWQRLTRSAPELMGGKQSIVQKVERDGKTFWRLRTGGFADVADATEFCAKVRAKGSACTIASF